MATHQRKESACTGNKIPDPGLASPPSGRKVLPRGEPTHDYRPALLGDVHARLQPGHASHGACGDVRFSGWVSRWYGERRVPGSWSRDHCRIQAETEDANLAL